MIRTLQTSWTVASSRSRSILAYNRKSKLSQHLNPNCSKSIIGSWIWIRTRPLSMERTDVVIALLMNSNSRFNQIEFPPKIKANHCTDKRSLTKASRPIGQCYFTLKFLERIVLSRNSDRTFIRKNAKLIINLLAQACRLIFRDKFNKITLSCKTTFWIHS